MNLAGFSAPTTELYWVEDYVTKDTKYSLGTKVKTDMADGSEHIKRYQDALKQASDIYIIPQTDHLSKNLDNKYVCLALGYHLYYVSLVKKGLNPGDAAIFDIFYYSTSTGAWVSEPHMTIMFSRPKDAVGAADVTRSIVLTAGVWKFVEQDWSLDWKYTKGATTAQTATYDSTLDGYNINNALGKTYKFTFENIPTSTIIPSAEAIKINTLEVDN